jgi:hypothetical protein
VLVLLGWAGWGLAPRAWEAGRALLGQEAAEKAVLGELVRAGLQPALARAAQEVNRLKQTLGGQRELDTLPAALMQSQRQFDRDFPGDGRKPAILLIMNKIEDQPQREIVIEKARALADGINSIGWGTEGETSRLKLAPVLSARTFADKINFGKVRRVEGRRIELEIQPPTPEEIEQFHARHPAPGH